MRLVGTILVLLLAACKPRAIPYAAADLTDPQGRRVGLAGLTQRQDGVEVQLTAWGLPPGTHSLQLRRGATCDDVVAHELPEVDMPECGTLTLTATIPGAQLAPGRNGLLSSALAPDGCYVVVGSVACGPLHAFGGRGSEGSEQ